MVLVGKDSNPPAVDPALRERIMEQIPRVTDALDAAVAKPTDDALEKLREETDKLMRALGRVLIEVERQRSAPKH
jgi:hypothetical protein